VVSEISLERRPAAYSDGLYPEWDPVVLGQENVSWCLYHRDVLEDNIERLSDEQRAVLEATDRVVIEHASEIAEWCEADGRWRERARERISKERWWWWLDLIANGTYPVRLLPAHLRQTALCARRKVLTRQGAGDGVT